MNDFADLRDAYNQAGPDAEDEMEDLRRFLNFITPKRARYATSIITRSEAQLIGVSVPRFAIRFYFPDDKGFVNCRRLKVLSENIMDNIGCGWGRRDADMHPEERNKEILDTLEHPPLVEILENESAVADCFLSIPRDKYPVADYIVNWVKLSHNYGELIVEEGAKELIENYPGTPYVRCIDFGGGLCAQAVCYMATTLLKEHSERVCGLADITALAHPPQCNELVVSGLKLDHIVRYFSNVGLQTQLQIPCENLSQHSENRWVADRWLKEFRVGLDAYLVSRMPIIFLTDMLRLYGKPGQAPEETIYGFNKFMPDRGAIAEMKPEHAGHAFVLLGCEMADAKENGNDRIYLLHDSAMMPYMKAKLEHLAKAGPYWPARPDSDWLDGLIMPVVPKAVKMPLLWWKENEDQQSWSKGLLGFSSDFHNATEVFPSVDTKTKPSEFCLLQIRDLAKTASTRAVRGIANEQRVQFARELNEHAVELSDRMKWTNEHWVWVESNSLPYDSVWIWDAEVPIDTIRPHIKVEVSKYLRLVLYLCGSGMVEKWT